MALRQATADGLNAAGAQPAPYAQERMRWIFPRATNHQIGTFDAAWRLSDPWPGEGEEKRCFIPDFQLLTGR